VHLFPCPALRQRVSSRLPLDTTPHKTVSDPRAKVLAVVKIDVEAIGAMLDVLNAPRSRYEDMEPDYEYLEPVPRCTCSCH
jgi:hypothetical protein